MPGGVWILSRLGYRNKSKRLDLFRRTRATDLYQQGVELALVSRILGHASMETTKVYAKPSVEQMREAMSKVGRVDRPEEAGWVGDEEMMARLCGLR